MKPYAVLGILLLALASAPARADMAAIRKRGQLRVLVAGGAPQLFTWKPNLRPGLEREILEGFARLQRVDLAIVPLAGRGGLLPALLKDEGDLAGSGLSAGGNVPDEIRFSAEILPSRHVVVSRKPAATVLTL